MKFVIFEMEISHLMQTVVNPGIANSECFLKMYKADFAQKFVVNLGLEDPDIPSGHSGTD